MTNYLVRCNIAFISVSAVIHILLPYRYRQLNSFRLDLAVGARSPRNLGETHAVHVIRSGRWADIGSQVVNQRIPRAEAGAVAWSRLATLAGAEEVGVGGNVSFTTAAIKLLALNQAAQEELKGGHAIARMWLGRRRQGGRLLTEVIPRPGQTRGE